MTFERVLVATDFSDPSIRAARFAKSLAPDAAFRIAHALAPLVPQPIALRADATAMQSALKRVEDEAARAIASFALAVPLPNAETRVVPGSVGAEIGRQAADFRADLVALGARGKSAIERLLLGSNARAILNHATCSLLVARGDAERAPSRILVATDFQETARAAIDRAGSIAKSARAELILHHALDAGVFGTILDLPEASSRGHERADRAWLDGAVKSALHDVNESALGGKAREVVTTGRPVDEISALASRENADLLVIGTHGGGAVERALLGSVAHELVEEAPCSVLVVRG